MLAQNWRVAQRAELAMQLTQREQRLRTLLEPA